MAWWEALFELSLHNAVILHEPFRLILEYAMGLHMSPTSEELSGADSYCFEQLEARGM